MRVNIASLRGHRGADLQARFCVDAVPGLDWGKGASQSGPIAVEATVTNTGSCFLVRGDVRTKVMLTCDRCLRSFQAPLVAVLEEEFYPAQGERGGPSGQADQFAEDNVFSGDTIDLMEAVREQSVLALPYKVLCREDCTGLCPGCGRRIDEGHCDCQRETLDPRMAKLSRLLTDPAE